MTREERAELYLEFIDKAPDIAALIKRLEEENKRLEKAIEWACKTITGDTKGEWGDCVNLSWFEPELRRLAGTRGGSEKDSGKAFLADAIRKGRKR